ncbi:MAG: hypothetical protein HY554_14425 [Elusimicrobia bacterium]|nr:hypothetical protein [Elusimicrobiota bacterium]
MEVLTPIKIVRAPRRHSGGVAAGAPDAGYRAYELLYFGAAGTMLLAGLAKLFTVMADWSAYVPPLFADWFGSTGAVVVVAGVLQTAIGLLVAFKPKQGAWATAAYLGAAIIALFVLGGRMDTAIRCVGLLFGAVALAKLADEYGERKHGA